MARQPESHEDALLALEQRVLQQAAGDFLAAVDLLRAMLLTSAPGVERKLLAIAIPAVEARISAGIVEGYTLGAAWALGALDGREDADDVRERVDRKPPRELLAPVRGMDATNRSAKSRAVRLLRNGAAVAVAVIPLFEAATRVRATVTTQVNAASNAASEQVGVAAGLDMVWEAERDACVHCLKLAGEVVHAGGTFPLASYGVLPKAFGRISRPPRHPHCRCRLAVLVDPSYAVALKREAQRSILRGFALPTERPAVRVEAAKQLLADGVTAPKSVKQYARAAVKDGAFPTRKVPEGDPRVRVRSRTRTSAATQ